MFAINVEVTDRCNWRSDTCTFRSRETFLQLPVSSKKDSRGPHNSLCIDMAVIIEVKSRNKNLAMAWIDYKKAYDMVPHSWIIEFLDLFGVAVNIKNLLLNSMEKWKVRICSGNSGLCEVEIKRGIFQGDSLFPLVFVLALIPLSLILRKAKAAYEFSESKEKINHLFLWMI